MEDKLSIRVSIAERFYPLRIERGDEEKVRKASKLINEKLLSFKQRHTDRDVQDWLAMVCLFFSLKLIENEQNQDFNAALKGLQDLERKLSEYLEYAAGK
jgi:cell division protein ZapA